MTQKYNLEKAQVQGFGHPVPHEQPLSSYYLPGQGWDLDKEAPITRERDCKKIILIKNETWVDVM